MMRKIIDRGKIGGEREEGSYQYMKKNKRKFIFISLILLFLSTVSFAKISYRAKGGVLYDSNVYRNNRSFSDQGIYVDLGLSKYFKLTKNIYSNIRYNLYVRNFFKYDLENNDIHELTFALKQYLNSLIILGFDLPIVYNNVPHTKEYSFFSISYFPYILLYPTYSTDIKIGFKYLTEKYPYYNFDNTNRIIHLSLNQNITKSFNLGFVVLFNNKRFSENKIYDVASDLSEGNTLREDSTKTYVGYLDKRIDKLGVIKIVYKSGVQNSNDNTIYWGDYQSSEDNTIIGDERILENFWDYKTNSLRIAFNTSLAKNTLLELDWRYENDVYDGFLARDDIDVIHSPETLRQDKKHVISFMLKKKISKISVEIMYYNINNQSNDFYYDYTANVFKLGIIIPF